METQLHLAGEAAKPALLAVDAGGMRLVKLLIRAARAVHFRNQPAARRAANKLLEWSEVATHPEAPAELFHLEFIGRELQIELSENRPKKFSALVSQARQSWEPLRLILEKAGDQTLVKDGDSLLDSLQSADDPDAMMQRGRMYLEFTRRVRDKIKGLPPP